MSESYCATTDEMSYFDGSGVLPNKGFCSKCDNKNYIRFADFTNENRSWFYERKTILDFINSRKRRVYEQMNKIDTFVEGRKGLILEGMSEYVPIYDSYWKNIDKKVLEKLSPIQQVIKLGGKPEWTMSFIKELKMRDMEFVQTWNLDETIDFLIQCNEGYDHTPKDRVLPKRYPDISLEQNILVLFDGVGKTTSEKLLKEYGSLANLIKELPNIKKKNKILQQLKEVFING
jgi:ERCC4-type nuclease